MLTPQAKIIAKFYIPKALALDDGFVAILALL